MFRKRGGSPVCGRLPPLVFYPPTQGVDKKPHSMSKSYHKVSFSIVFRKAIFEEKHKREPFSLIQIKGL